MGILLDGVIPVRNRQRKMAIATIKMGALIPHAIRDADTVKHRPSSEAGICRFFKERCGVRREVGAP